MHYPAATSDQGVLDIPYTETWRAMEECVKLGLVRNIGMSSIYFSLSLSQSGLTIDFSKKEVETLLESCKIRPAVHQLEKHPYLPQNAFCKWHKEVRLLGLSFSILSNFPPSSPNNATKTRRGIADS